MRRTMLSLAFAAACMMSLGMGVVSFAADKPVTLRIGHPMAPGNNVTIGYEKFKELVEKTAAAKLESEFSAMHRLVPTA